MIPSAWTVTQIPYGRNRSPSSSLTLSADGSFHFEVDDQGVVTKKSGRLAPVLMAEIALALEKIDRVKMNGDFMLRETDAIHCEFAGNHEDGNIFRFRTDLGGHPVSWNGNRSAWKWAKEFFGDDVLPSLIDTLYAVFLIEKSTGLIDIVRREG